MAPSSRTPTSSGRLQWLGWSLAGLFATLLIWLWWPSQPARVADLPATADSRQAAATIERGRYLATVGNCQGCHSLPGQPPYAGGTPLTTPFGTLYGPNLTPSPEGIGDWSASDFWRALHLGQAPDGRLLSPAFPYTSTTHIRREDSDAIYAYLQSLPPDPTPNRPSEVRWPFHTQPALKAWRALYFTPAAPITSAPALEDEIARGRYLTEGLGHCSACHSPRNRWGGFSAGHTLSGGLMPSGWYAPSLLDPNEAGVQDWDIQAVVDLLRDGKSDHHTVTGPMAEVVAQSLSHWDEADLHAMARFLVALPVHTVPARRPGADTAPVDRALGARLYEQHCAACHGVDGQGFRIDNGHVAYPPLAGNRAVTLRSPANLVRIVQEGGFGLPTPSHPQPFGMPPFQLVLDDHAMAALLTHMRQSWGNQGAPVQALDVHKLRNPSRR